MAKKLEGVCNNCYRLMNAKLIRWVLGTVLISGLKDILSPAFLFWFKLGVDFNDWKGLLLGDPRVLFHPDYDPMKAVSTVKLDAEGLGAAKGLLHEDLGFVQTDPGKAILAYSTDHRFPDKQGPHPARGGQGRLADGHGKARDRTRPARHVDQTHAEDAPSIAGRSHCVPGPGAASDEG